VEGEKHDQKKSLLTEPMMSALGKMLKATIGENITEDFLRAACGNIGTAAVAQQFS